MSSDTQDLPRAVLVTTRLHPVSRPSMYPRVPVLPPNARLQHTPSQLTLLCVLAPPGDQIVIQTLMATPVHQAML